MFYKASGSISPLRLHTVSYVLYFHVIISAFIGSLLVATETIHNHYLIDPITHETKIYAWLLVLYSMIMMPVGMMLLNWIFNVKPVKEFNEYLDKKVFFQYSTNLTRIILLIMVLIPAISLIYTFINTENIPLYTLLVEGDSQKAAIERVAARRDFQGIDHIKNLFGLLLAPVFTYYAFIHADKRRRWEYWMFFILMFLITILFYTYDIQKAKVVFFFLGFLIVFTFIYKGIPLFRFVEFIAAAVLLIILGYYLTGGRGMDQLTDIESAFYGRLFITGYAGFPLSLEFFPDVIDVSTKHIGLPSYLLEKMGLHNVESARLLMMQINPHGVEAGDANLISTYFMGEAWANYRYWGVFLAPLVVGVVIQSVHIFLLRHRKDPLIIAFYAYITISWLTIAGFVNFLYLKQILYLLLLYVFLKIIFDTIANIKVEENG